MWRAIGIAKAGDALAVDHNLAALGFQRMVLRVAAEISETDELRVLFAFRHFDQLVRFPERRKWRQRYALRRTALPGDLVKRLQPLQIRFPFGKTFTTARFPPLAQFSKHVKIITCFIARRHNALHRYHMLVAVIAGHGEIVTLKRRGRRQHNIRMFGRSGPEALGNHHQLRLLPGADQAIGILMVREVRPARPPDKFNIREMAVQTVVLIKTARVFQGFNDSRHRDFIHGIHAACHRTLQRSQHRRFARWVSAVGKMIGETKTAARRTDLPEHGGKRDQHPVLLLAKLLALHPPAGH